MAQKKTGSTLYARNAPEEVVAAVRVHQGALTVESGGQRITQSDATLDALTVGLRALGLLTDKPSKRRKS